MRRTRYFGAALLGLSLALGVGSAQSGKAAATPEEAVKNMLAAMHAGDFAALTAQLGEPSRTIFEGMTTYQLATENLALAFEAKFGKDPKAPVIPLKDALKKTKAIRIVSKEGTDKLDLTVWVTEEVELDKKVTTRVLEHLWYAVKEGGGWKLLVPLGSGKTKIVLRKGPDGKEVAVTVFEKESKLEGSPKETEHLKTSAVKYKALAEGFAKDIQGGKYKNREEAEKAWVTAEATFRKDNPPPGEK